MGGCSVPDAGAGKPMQWALGRRQPAPVPEPHTLMLTSQHREHQASHDKVAGRSVVQAPRHQVIWCPQSDGGDVVEGGSVKGCPSACWMPYEPWLPCTESAP